MEGRFRTNSPPVVHETVEGETIVVNLDTGSYYDLNELGGSILGLLNQGMTVAELTSLVAGTYGLDVADAGRAVEGFATQLVAEQLLVPSGSADEYPASSWQAPGDAPELPAGYSEPALNKYTDMQELLLLDPVHEVDEAGWPSKV